MSHHGQVPQEFSHLLDSVKALIDRILALPLTPLNESERVAWKSSMYKEFSLNDYQLAHQGVLSDPLSATYLRSLLERILHAEYYRVRYLKQQFLAFPEALLADVKNNAQRLECERKLNDALRDICREIRRLEGDHRHWLNEALEEWVVTAGRLFGLNRRDHSATSTLTLKSQDDVNSLIYSIGELKDRLEGASKEYLDQMEEELLERQMEEESLRRQMEEDPSERQMEEALSARERRNLLPTSLLAYEPKNLLNHLTLEPVRAPPHARSPSGTHGTLSSRPHTQMSLRKRQIYRIPSRDQSFL
ncbi:uncharacterized protein JCM6883_004794 [Sporobolomyces salmoneus]|uniref:uncharacterized protein n=1 Tax=Sporobolomyces salmoneus TaxID=183962 RepID=UPI00316CFEB8